MKRCLVPLFLLVIATALPLPSAAQSYQPFPDGTASWEIIRCWYLFDFGWYQKYSITMDGTDTLYEGEVFKNLYLTIHHLPDTEFDTIFPTEFFGGIREEDKQIFIYQKWASTDTTVQMVYDFNNTDVGDTIFTNVLSGNPNLFGHIVVENDSVLVGNQYHKRILLEDPSNNSNTEYWIEGIGSSWGLPFATFWSVTDNSYDLSCFNDDSFYYENPEPTFLYCLPPFAEIFCEPIVSNVSELETNVFFNLSPNPASDFVKVDVNQTIENNILLTIYDMTGRPVWTRRMDQKFIEIETIGLRNGIYLVTIQSEEVLRSRKLIIFR